MSGAEEIAAASALAEGASAATAGTALGAGAAGAGTAGALGGTALGAGGAGAGTALGGSMMAGAGSAGAGAGAGMGALGSGTYGIPMAAEGAMTIGPHGALAYGAPSMGALGTGVSGVSAGMPTAAEAVTPNFLQMAMGRGGSSLENFGKVSTALKAGGMGQQPGTMQRTSRPVASQQPINMAGSLFSPQTQQNLVIARRMGLL